MVQRAVNIIAEHQAHDIGLQSCDKSKGCRRSSPHFRVRMSKAGVKRAFALLPYLSIRKGWIEDKEGRTFTEKNLINTPSPNAFPATASPSCAEMLPSFTAVGLRV